MSHLTTDDGIKLYYEETGTGIPLLFVHEFAGDCLLRAAGALLLPALPLHHLQCTRLSALRRPGRRRAVFAAARGRRHPRRAGCARDREGACSRPLDGWLRDAPFRHELSRTCALAGDRRLRLWRRARATAEISGGIRSLGEALREPRHEGSGRDLRAGSDPGAVSEQGPARLARIRRAARRAFEGRSSAYPARRAEAKTVALR